MMPVGIKREELSAHIMEFLEEETGMLYVATCSCCPGVVVDRGIKAGGLKSEPDEVGCPCDFEIGGRGCIKKNVYNAVKELVDEIAAILEEEIAANR